MRILGMIALACSVACTERALEIPDDGGHRDLSGHDLRGGDLADLALRPRNLCPAGTQFIYTIDADATLSRFNPTTAQFFDVGPIGCPGGGGPNSMAIDRDGNGWVNYLSGDLFRLLIATDGATATCSTSGYVPRTGGFRSFGMSFAEDTPGSTSETLFVAGSSPTGRSTLGRIDTTTLLLHDLVTIQGGADAELTGDDQANLFAFFPGDRPAIARIDKNLGTLDRVFQLPVLAGAPIAWGVAAYRGDFYVFLERSSDPFSSVYRVDGTNGAVTTVVGNTGREIVGVGVATCAGDNGLD